MEQRPIAKRYYRIEFQLASALAVGSGMDETTDKDIVRNSKGDPYIPATALAGIYRTLFEEKEAAYYFGTVIRKEQKTEAADSRFIVYDAVLRSRQYNIGYRDCVGLDSWKTAVPGAKFDFEILEPGVVFVTYIEQNKYAGDQNAGDVIADAWEKEDITIGGKGTRGLGKIKNAKVDILEFSFTEQKEIDKWLDFDLYDDCAWIRYEKEFGCAVTESVPEHYKKSIHLKLKLEQKGPLIIRSYTTKVKSEQGMPDYTQLAYMRKQEKGEDSPKEIPVIPGTSWAGAFRHQMKQLDPDCIGQYFGENAKQKSRITFGESEIVGAADKLFTRNAIDRFTGGTVDNALYTEKLCYGGHTELAIVVTPDKAAETFLQCLAAAIVDLHMGFLAIGGENAIGRGLFTLTEILCKEEKLDINLQEPDQIYEALLGAMLDARKE